MKYFKILYYAEIQFTKCPKFTFKTNTFFKTLRFKVRTLSGSWFQCLML